MFGSTRTPILTATAVAALAVPVVITAAAVTAAGARDRTQTASVPACVPAQTQVWLGLGLGGGTAGTYYYPLEFTNVGHSTCTLSGYPGVSAYRGAGQQVGTPGTRNQTAHATVTLAPGATAHAQLGVHDYGALCKRGVAATGLKVYPPGETRSWSLGFPLRVCASRSVLVVGPVRPGVGVPGYTTT
jgi:hypothetical protein